MQNEKVNFRLKSVIDLSCSLRNFAPSRLCVKLSFQYRFLFNSVRMNDQTAFHAGA